jgi:phytanoyl-CoA hydroxylase
MATRPPSSAPVITADDRACFDRDGFLVLPGFAEPSACAALIARARALVDAFEPPEARSVFTSGEDQARTADAYFLSSGDKIRFFFEAGALDARGALVRDKALAINKIGHALHDLDPTFAAFSRSPRLAALAADLGLVSPLLMQSMYIFKQPHIGGEVVCHQDATYLYTEPLSVVGFWFALEDATIENGAMWALPGGHRQGLKARFKRAGEGVRTDVIDATPWPAFARENGYVPLEAKQGTLVVLHGLLPHLSGANTSDRSRHAYALHVVEAAARYPEDNWLQRGDEMPARGFDATA